MVKGLEMAEFQPQITHSEQPMDSTMTAEATQTMGFQTEAKRLLHLMIHSLYSNREIFLRELISNASDAIDKHRFAVLGDPELGASVTAYRIRVETNAEAKTITIDDNGIGMSREEVIDNLGTIAKSGTAAFMEQLSGDQKQDSQLIGQFGVGFYSSFIVADRVEVLTRKAGAASATLWASAGEDEFTVAAAEREESGTTITLHLKSDAEEFADSWRVRSVIKKYSDHISVPVMMPDATPAADADDDTSESLPEWKAVNEAKALWTRSRTDISDEEYQGFYKHISHDFEDALTWSHNAVEGKLEYTSLLYLPRRAPFDLWHREGARGLKLYVQRTFIMDEAEHFLPMYLRFVKGVLDSNDLPLNVSREILQQNQQVDTIRGALTKRVLDMLSKMASKQPEDYEQFWDTFGVVLKEGPAEDFTNREKIADLLRFSTTRDDESAQRISLKQYVESMAEDQTSIYYVVAENHATAKNSPHIESLRKRGVEVLLLSDRVDEWLMSHLGEYDGKALRDCAKGSWEEEGADEATKKALEEAEKASESLIERMQSILKDRVESVRPTTRLTSSPACLTVAEHEMGAQMRKILEAAGQAMPDTKPTLEINVDHPLLTRLDQEVDEERFADLAQILLDQAFLAEGSSLEDPASYVSRLNKLLVELSE